MDIPELMTVREFLALYIIGRTTFYREDSANRIKLRKLGSSTRVARTDAEAWLNNLPVRDGEAA